MVQCTYMVLQLAFVMQGGWMGRVLWTCNSGTLE